MTMTRGWKIYVDPRKKNVHIGRIGRMNTLKILFPFPMEYEIFNENRLNQFLNGYKRKSYFIIWHQKTNR